MIEAGNYRARAVEAALGETQGGKEEVAVKFEMLDAPGTFLTWYGYFTEKTLETSIKALRTAGWTGQDITDLSELAVGSSPEVQLVVEHEEGQDGRLRPRVRWVNHPGGVGLKKALEPARAKVFAAQLRAAVVAFDKAVGTPKLRPPAQIEVDSSTAAPVDPAAVSDEEVPF